MADRLSDAALIVLRELGSADSKKVLRAAIKELISAGVWHLRWLETAREGAPPSPWLAAGNRQPPPVNPLPSISRAIEATPALDASGELLRDLGAVLRHMEMDKRRVRKRIVQDLLEDLEGSGLVRSKQRRLLGTFRRGDHVRTAEGERLLGDLSQRLGSGADLSAFTGGLLARHAGEEATDQDGLDASLGSAFTVSFDSAFDSGVDSASDSGWSGGGSDDNWSGGDGGGGDDGGGE